MKRERLLGYLTLGVFLFATLAWWSGGLLAAEPQTRVKNVIIMVADGAGFNTWLAASMYRGQVGKEIYDQPGWIRLACTTFPLNTATQPQKSGRQDPNVVYSPEKAWDPESGYKWLRSSATDSAAAATALATGKKTYNNAINWSDLDQSMTGQTLPEIAHRLGKSAGVVTTVPWSHATPAALGGAHNRDRDNYAEIAQEMLAAPYLQVIMGAGHPLFDNNGQPRKDQPTEKDYRYVGGSAEWKKLVAGQHPGGWTLIEKKEDFEKLVSGPTPEKVVGTAQVATTLQQARGGLVKMSLPGNPFAEPLNDSVPCLAVMVEGALNVLDDDPDGFYLMIEGGAVDWANHANQLHRMIEEHSDWLAAVEAVVKWVEKNSSWDETLVILTADHECGCLWGPASGTKPFDPLCDQGPGKMPGARYNATKHTNELVPLYARGVGAERLLSFVRGKDHQAARVWGISGDYVDNTDIGQLLRSLITGEHAMAQ
ncbi:MAG: alkaline phosphatase [Thermogutta sp.]